MSTDATRDPVPRWWLALAAAGLVAVVATAVLLRARGGSGGTMDRAARPAAGPCLAPASAVSLHHVVVAVPDLDAAAQAYRALGFTLKKGRLHPSGLLNEHVKLADGSELELMSLVREPGDDMARRYAAILAAGGGGAYAALRAPAEAVVGAARRSGVAIEESRVEATRYVTLTEAGNEAVFFFESPGTAADPDSVLTHANGAAGVTQAWVEGGAVMARLLQALGSVACGPVLLPDGSEAQLFGVANGSVALVPSAGGRARLLGASLVGGRTHARVEGGATRWLPPSRTLGVWLGVPGRPPG